VKRRGRVPKLLSFPDKSGAQVAQFRGGLEMDGS